MTKGKLLGVLAGMLFATASHAAPISYTYSGDWSSFFSAPFDSAYTATVIFDNGGNTIANQTFVQADFVSATVISGAYSFTMTAADITDWLVDFTSNAAGQLGAGWFDASAAGHSWHFDTWFPDVSVSAPNGASAGFFSSNVSDVGVLLNGVPEPATLALLGLAMAGIGLARRRA